MKTRKVEREPVAVSGQCRTADGRVLDIALNDLTTGGCGFADPDGTLTIGVPVDLMLVGAGPYRAYVRWASDGLVGVSFQQPLDAQSVSQLIAGETPSAMPAAAPELGSDAGSASKPLPLRRIC